MRWFRLLKKSCFRVRDHVAWPPPSVEICHLPPGPGNGRTKISPRPFSDDVYAIHRPSGENIGSDSVNGPFAKAVGFPAFQPDASSPSIGRIITSSLLCVLVSVNARYFPEGCHDPGDCVLPLVSSRSGGPAPSARTQNRLNAPEPPVALNAILRPSGVHTTGPQCRPASNV